MPVLSTSEHTSLHYLVVGADESLVPERPRTLVVAAFGDRAPQPGTVAAQQEGILDGRSLDHQRRYSHPFLGER